MSFVGETTKIFVLPTSFQVGPGFFSRTRTELILKLIFGYKNCIRNIILIIALNDDLTLAKRSKTNILGQKSQKYPKTHLLCTISSQTQRESEQGF